MAGEWDAWSQLDAGGLELVEGEAPADLVLFGAGEHGLQCAAALLGVFGQLLEVLQRVGEAAFRLGEGDLADGWVGALLAQVQDAFAAADTQRLESLSAELG
jgi:hypothetical protein